jgi:hypothetical protein
VSISTHLRSEPKRTGSRFLPFIIPVRLLPPMILGGEDPTSSGKEPPRLSRHNLVCASRNPLRIAQMVLFREPFGPLWVTQVDRMDPVLLVHLSKRIVKAGCTLVAFSLIEHTEFNSPYGCLHALANPQLLADVAYVPLYGARADGEGASYLLVGLSPHH